MERLKLVRVALCKILRCSIHCLLVLAAWPVRVASGQRAELDAAVALLRGRLMRRMVRVEGRALHRCDLNLVEVGVKDIDFHIMGDNVVITQKAVTVACLTLAIIYHDLIASRLVANSKAILRTLRLPLALLPRDSLALVPGRIHAELLDASNANSLRLPLCSDQLVEHDGVLRRRKLARLILGCLLLMRDSGHACIRQVQADRLVRDA